MSRRSNRQVERLQAILLRLQNGFNGTPLQDVGDRLRTFGIGIISAIQAGTGKLDQALKAANYLDHTITALPNSFKSRFYFDAAMIQALSDLWNCGRVRLSSMIVPRHGFSWGHSRQRMPSEDKEKAHCVDLIYFPGEDIQDEIDLLEYPFICHELGHYVFQENECQFSEKFEHSLNMMVGQFQLRTLSDRGSTKDRAQRTIQDIYQFWHPTPSHKNWAHELAMDIIALWTCGPAYLDVFDDQLENCNPYQVDQEHPPYEVRAIALTEAGRQLGWENQIPKLLQRIENWRHPKSKIRRTNRYITLANAGLIRECIAFAFQTCDSLALPKCTKDTVEEVKSVLDRGETPDFGLHAILSAQMVRRKCNERDYETWEKITIAELMKCVMQ
jgi:hypothetical protein